LKNNVNIVRLNDETISKKLDLCYCSTVFRPFLLVQSHGHVNCTYGRSALSWRS